MDVFFFPVNLPGPTDPQTHVIAVAGRVIFLSGLSFRAAAHGAKVDGDADDEPDDPTLTTRQRQAPEHRSQDLEDRDRQRRRQQSHSNVPRGSAPKEDKREPWIDRALLTTHQASDLVTLHGNKPRILLQRTSSQSQSVLKNLARSKDLGQTETVGGGHNVPSTKMTTS